MDDEHDLLPHHNVGEASPTLPMEGLVVLQGGRLDLLEGPGGSLEIGHQPLVIGRGARCALRLPDDGHVSLVQALMQATPAGVLLRVLGTRANTFVGPVCIPAGHEVYLTAACTIYFGLTRLRFVPGECEQLPLPHGERFGRLVGRSPKMRTLFALIERYADAPLSVLISGETGTGKELVAHAIHKASSRRNKPFVGINCARFDPQNVEDELFGHVRGAYTDAAKARDGAFVAADGGTLLLDEAGDMKPDMQKKLLRVLEEKEVRPIGSDKPRRVDVRTIFATHANLRARVNEGAFREDLYHRIAGLSLDVPPLRERDADWPLLLTDLLAELGRPEVTLDHRAQAILKGHEWEGNIRELKVVLTLAVHGFSGDVLSEDAFPFLGPFETKDGSHEDSLRAQVVALERKELTRLARAHNGNVSQIAQAADYDRRRVRELLKLFGLYQHPASPRPNGQQAKGGWLARMGLPARRTP